MMGLREQLLAVREARGTLTPEFLVEEATPVEHPLHNRFEWDNAIAGPAYRKVQARELIRSCRVVYAPGGATEVTGSGDEVKHQVRAFVAIPQEDTPAAKFEPVEVVANDEFQRKLLLLTAEREWKSLRSKYQHLSEFIELVRGDVQDEEPAA